jgi:GH15 family glucan-1,4-alpha-glucosidase
MYGIHGERTLTERTLSQLSGYRDSRPVRVGNGAYQQRQLDVFGEVLDALWFYYQHGGTEDGPPRIDPPIWSLMREIADFICEVWRQTDHGIWEIRGDERQYVYSKLMCWVGLDRAVQLAAKAGVEGNADRWERERDAIRREILTRGYNDEIGAFTMTYDSDDLDAALLRLPLVGFLPTDDPRVASTVDVIQQKLQVDGLVRRYRVDDHLPGEEGAFSICTFWLVDCLTGLGRIDEARKLFEQMLGYASDLGLYSEEIDPATGAALGNYPQAFTHLALIDAGVDLAQALESRESVPGDHSQRAKEVRRGRRRRGQPGGKEHGASAAG